MRIVQLPLPVARAIARAGLGNILDNRFSTARQLSLLNNMARTIPPPPGTEVEALTLGGRPADRVVVGTADSASAVLYLHGGGYTTASPATHRSLAALIARDTGAAVYVLD
ncbi:MAG TPA: alpha/beta hydrolase fold domain-containing protein, partial [Micromonosporaceae bacterium]